MPKKPESTGSLKPEDMKILVVGDRVWGKGDTIKEALGKCPGKTKYYNVYIAHPDTRVDEMGYLTYPTGMSPKMIISKLPKAATKSP